MYTPYFESKMKPISKSSYYVKGANDTYFTSSDKSSVKKLAWLIYAPSGIPYEIYSTKPGAGGKSLLDGVDSFSQKEMEKAQKEVSKLPSYHPANDPTFLKTWEEITNIT